jgi:hypothetical protein
MNIGVSDKWMKRMIIANRVRKGYLKFSGINEIKKSNVDY